MEYLFLIVIWVALLFGGVVTFFYTRRRKKLTDQQISYYRGEIRKCASLSASERMMRYDKILNHILRDYGYSGTVAEQLKSKPRVIHDLDLIWDLHKLRNKLAHDLDHISDRVVEKKAGVFEKELERLLKS